MKFSKHWPISKPDHNKTSMQKSKYIVFIQLLVFILSYSLMILSACKKDTVSVTGITEISTGTESRINDVCLRGNTIWLVTGVSGESGQVLKSTDGGSDWQVLLTVAHTALYDIDFYNDQMAYVCGDSLHLINTVDGGLNWKVMFTADSAHNWDEYLCTIRKVKYNDPLNIVAVGGDRWYKGIMVWSNNWGQNWLTRDLENQLNDLCMRGTRQLWMSGYGILLHSGDSCNTTTTLDLSGDFYTACDFWNNLTGLACGYNGGIYLTTDGGNSWTEVVHQNGSMGNRKHFNDILFIDENRVLACGNGGLLMISNDGGLNWNEIKSGIEKDLYCMTAGPDASLWVGGDEGYLCKITL
jgi:photosystem II stability/assembly factor-like uncharacterized protein